MSTITLTTEHVFKRIKERFEGSINHAYEPWGLLTIGIDYTKNYELLSFLRDEEDLQFNFLTDLCGVHWPNDKEKFEVVYHLHSLVNNFRLRIKARIPGEVPHIKSVVKLFPTANWMERETYDFFGIHFDGHPDLRRILNVDEMVIFPLRKEYPLEDNVRTDKKDEMFGR